MRLFIALNLPSQLRSEIWDASAPLREADLPVRWVDRNVIHLTLKFLGEVAEDRLPSIRDAIDTAARDARVFPVPVGGFGAFPSVERPRVIWVGCEGVPPLELLAHRVEQGTEALGFPVEAKAFRPHLTLGRVQRDARPAQFRRLGSLMSKIEFETEWVVQSVDLMESTLGPSGPAYRALHTTGFSG